jgi:putative nucleotidyltransferase with HDIG domain
MNMLMKRIVALNGGITMAIVPLSQLKIGDRITEPVLTKRGSLLLDKGTVILQRELDILKAFLISIVIIDGKQETLDTEAGKAVEAEIKAPQASPFSVEYDKMLALFRKVMFTLRSGGPLPLLEIRQRLEALLQQSEHYHILKFAPTPFNTREYLLHNSMMTALTAYQMAKWMELPAKDWFPVALGGMLHDIGNAKVDENILEKKGALSHAEREEVRSHTVAGYQMLKNVPGLNEGVKLAAIQHHEREDGSGYPLALKRDKIHPYAKIIAIADTYHAMTCPRFYKQALSPYAALDALQAESFGKLDPVLVKLFVQKTASFTNGTIVRLNNGQVGAIVFTDPNAPTRPWVNTNGRILNLTSERELYIQEILQIS